jgi:multidrug resistance efflux pump
MIIAVASGALWYFMPSDNSSHEVSFSNAVTKEIEDEVIERGLIIAKEKVLVQTHVMGHIIDMKEDGDYVRKGDPLVIIDASQYDDSIIELEQKINEENLTLENQQEELRLINSEAHNQVLLHKDDLRHALIKQKEELSRPKSYELRKLNINLELAKLNLDESESEYARQKRLFDKEFISKTALEPYERSVISRKERVQDAKLNLKVAKKGVTEEIKVELAQKVARAKANLDRVEGSQQRRVEAQKGKIKETENRIAQNQFELNKVVGKSKKSVCYAETDGYIVLRRFWGMARGKYLKYTTGGKVGERNAIMEIVKPETMVANVIFNEADYHRLKVGMEAELTLPAFKNQKFKGVLTSLGQIGKDRNDWLGIITGTSSVAMYNGTITIEGGGLTKFQPGMSLIAQIKVNSTHKGLVVPRSAVKTEDDKFWVYAGGRKTEVKGRTVNDFDFEITQGLNEGQEVTTYYPERVREK